MAKKGSRFRYAAALADQIAATARKKGNSAAVKQADVISRVAMTLANTERGLGSQANDLISALSDLGRSLKRRGGANVGGRSSEDGYYVRITGNRGTFGNAQYKGLVGKRVGRGPVSVSPGNRSTKAVTAAFAKIIEAQTQLSQLQAEVERLKHRK